MTSKEWWNKVKGDQQEFERWLTRQYIGEVTAVRRLMELRVRFRSQMSDLEWIILSSIISDEVRHSVWIKGILKWYGVSIPEVPKEDGTRYWQEALAEVQSLYDWFGISHHAETMRLERIQAICDDTETSPLVKATFLKILDDEKFHARAFGLMAGVPAIERTAEGHSKGRKALGLEP